MIALRIMIGKDATPISGLWKARLIPVTTAETSNTTPAILASMIKRRLDFVAILQARVSRTHMHDNFMEAGDAGERTTVFFPFLDCAFAVSRPDDERVIVRAIGLPFITPERPG